MKDHIVYKSLHNHYKKTHYINYLNISTQRDKKKENAMQITGKIKSKDNTPLLPSLPPPKKNYY